MNTNKHECKRDSRPAAPWTFVSISVHSWLSLRRVVERGDDVEMLQALSQLGIVGCINDPVILNQLEQSALGEHLRNLLIVAQRDDLWVFAKLAGAGVRQEPLGVLRIGRYLSHFANQVVSSLWDDL